MSSKEIFRSDRRYIDWNDIKMSQMGTMYLTRIMFQKWGKAPPVNRINNLWKQIVFT